MKFTVKYLFVLAILVCPGAAIPLSFNSPENLPAPSAMGKIASVMSGRTMLIQPTSSSYETYYWFHAGAEPSRLPVHPTGVEVDIQVVSQAAPARAYSLSSWIGMETSNDAFIQVGYVGYYEGSHRQMPAWFWEYFPAGKADDPSYSFEGGIGDKLTLGDWVHFRLQTMSLTGSAVKTWGAYVNDKLVGSYDLGITYGSRPYASAEVGGSTGTDDVLSPVHFRNLAYRDTGGVWHQVEKAKAFDHGARLDIDWIGYCGSDWGWWYYCMQPYYDSTPIGLQSTYATNNDWTAGTGVPWIADNATLWPWHHLTVTSPIRSIDKYYVEGNSVWLEAKQFENATSATRQRFDGWSVNGVIDRSISSLVLVTKDMDIKSVYVTQYYLNVTSPLGKTTGSGWYDTGSNATIKVTPFSIPINDAWGRTFSMRQVVSGWSGDFNGLAVNGTSKVRVTSPMHVIAVWHTDYGTLPFFVLLPAGAASIAIVLAFYRKRLPILNFRGSKRKRTT